MPTPIGPETSWICPSLNPTQTGSPDELISGIAIDSTVGANVWAADTDNGGTYSITGARDERSLVSMLGLSSPAETVDRYGYGFWMKIPSGTFGGAYGVSFDEDAFEAGSVNTMLVNFDTQKYDSGGWLQSQIVVTVDTFAGGGLIRSGLKIVGLPGNGWTDAGWQSAMEGWNHWFIECDFPRGQPTAVADDGDLLGASPYHRIYLNGQLLDTGGTGNGQCVTNEGTFQLSNDNGCFFFGSAPSSATFDAADKVYMTGNTVWDDVRLFANTLPTSQELLDIAASRGAEGAAPSGPTGIGGETMWVCPTLSSTNGLDDLTGNGNSDPATLGDNIGIVTDTGEGGSHALRWGAGTDPVVTMSDGPNNSGQSSGSFSLWFKSETNSGVAGISGFNDANITGTAYGLGMTATGYAIIWHNVESGNTSTYSDALATGVTGFDSTWHHFAWSWESETNPVLYIDGVLVATSAYTTGLYGPVTTNTMNDFAGEFGSINGSYKLSGGHMSIDDYRTFNRALTQADVDNLSSVRGYDAVPAGPDGLGDELMWVCPSQSTSSLNTPDINDLSTNALTIDTPDTGGNTVWTANTGSGGQYLVEGNESLWTSGNVFGASTTGTNLNVSSWLEIPSIWPNPSTNGVWLSFGEDDYNNGWQLSFSLQLWASATFAQWIMKCVYIGPLAERFETSWSGLDLNAATVPAFIAAFSGTRHFSFNFDFSNPAFGPSDAVTMYFDGTEYTSGSAVTSSFFQGQYDFSSATSNVRWQGGSNTFNPELTRPMDDFRLLNRELTQAEITHLATSRGIEGPAGSTPSSVFFNPFQSKTFHTLISQRIR